MILFTLNYRYLKRIDILKESFSNSDYIFKYEGFLMYFKLISYVLFFLLILISCSDNPTSSEEISESGISGTLKDIDGNIYKTVKIGDQWWMAENLKATHFRDGTPIQWFSEGAGWRNTKEAAYSFYDNDSSKLFIYGNLYNGFAIVDKRNLAPKGWHIPSDNDWKKLEIYLGMNAEEANKTGPRGTTVKRELIKQDGLNALYGGFRSNDGYDVQIGGLAHFWTNTENDDGTIWYRFINVQYETVMRYNSSKSLGNSVRCIKD